MPTPAPQVYSFAVELTAQCNQQCRYCYNQPRRPADRSIASAAEHPPPAVEDAVAGLVLSRLERLLSTFDVDHVTLTGGEPFAQPAIWSALERLAARAVPAQIISNGGLIHDGVAERLAPYRVRYVQITLNGPDAALHAEHTGDERHFHGALAGVQALRRQGIGVVGCIVVTHLNAHRVGATLELWSSLGVEDIAMSRFSPAGQAVDHAPRLLPTLDDMVVAFGQARPYARERGLRVTCTMPIPPCMMETSDFAPIRFGSCAIGTDKQEFALGADGRLRNCTLHRQVIGDGRDIADPEVDPGALVRGAEVADYRRQYPTFCEGCLHASGCAGGCGAAAEWMLGPAEHARRHPDPFLWQHVDDELARRLGRPIGEEPAEAAEREHVSEPASEPKP